MIKDQVVFAELLVKAADKLGKKEEAEQTLVGLLKKFP